MFYSEPEGIPSGRGAVADDSPVDVFHLAAVADWLVLAVAVDPGSVEAEDLRSAALAVESMRRALDAVSVRVLGELDARGTTDITDGMRTGPWLAREGHLPTSATRARLKVADKLRRYLHDAQTALCDGRIGYDHAKVLTDAANPRIIDEFALVVGDLINLVPAMTFDRWKREVMALAELLDQDGGHRPGDDICDNTLSLHKGFEDTLALQGQLAGENALVIDHALNTRADQIFHRMKNDAELTDDLPVPPRRTLLALAMVELIREGLSHPTESNTPPQSDVSLIVNAQDPDTITDTTGVPIGNTASHTLLCDPVFQAVVMSVHGIVLDLGRDQRLVNRAQRRALAHRDGGCVWPGCENPPAWTDAHHVLHWRRGGETDLPNLALLCRYHHIVTHRPGWTMHTTVDQWFWWQSPTGDTFWSQRHHKHRTDPPPPPRTGPGPRETGPDHRCGNSCQLDQNDTS